MNETELVFTEILNCSRDALYFNRRSPLKRDKSLKIASVLKRRARGQPLQYILGRADFMGFKFLVNPYVLIPRPETEILVETVAKMCCGKREAGSGLSILDLCTGSGCIAVSLAKLLPQAEIFASDISERALEVASRNADLNKVHISLFQSDLFADFKSRPATRYPQPATYDLIVSNPPYVPKEEIGRLQPEVRHEPLIALDGGEDGLGFYRRIINEAPGYLKPQGLLAMEIGFEQAGIIKNIFQNSANFEIIEIVKDYNGIDRVIVAQNIKGY